MRSLLLIALSFFTTTYCYAESSVRVLDYKEYSKAVADIDPQQHTIGLKKLLELKKGGDITILDLRSEKEYQQGHISGAKHLGSNFTAKTLEKLIPSKETTVVLYCNNSLIPTRMMSLTHISLPQVMQLGYANTYMLDSLWQGNETIDGVEQLKTHHLWE